MPPRFPFLSLAKEVGSESRRRLVEGGSKDISSPPTHVTMSGSVVSCGAQIASSSSLSAGMNILLGLMLADGASGAGISPLAGLR